MNLIKSDNYMIDSYIDNNLKYRHLPYFLIKDLKFLYDCIKNDTSTGYHDCRQRLLVKLEDNNYAIPLQECYLTLSLENTILIFFKNQDNSILKEDIYFIGTNEDNFCKDVQQFYHLLFLFNRLTKGHRE